MKDNADHAPKYPGVVVQSHKSNCGYVDVPE